MQLQDIIIGTLQFTASINVANSSCLCSTQIFTWQAESPVILVQP